LEKNESLFDESVINNIESTRYSSIVFYHCRFA